MLIGWTFLCKKPLRLEVVGLMLTLAGISVMFMDASAVRTDGKQGGILVYGICVGCSLLGALFFMVNSHLSKQLPIMFLINVQSLTCFVLCAGLSKVFDSRTMIFSVDPVWGCFGFLDADQIVMSFVVFGLTAGFFGNAGYTICLMFCSPVIVSAVFLIEPIIA